MAIGRENNSYIVCRYTHKERSGFNKKKEKNYNYAWAQPMFRKKYFEHALVVQHENIPSIFKNSFNAHLIDTCTCIHIKQIYAK